MKIKNIIIIYIQMDEKKMLSWTTFLSSLIGVGLFFPSVREELYDYYMNSVEESNKTLSTLTDNKTYS